MEEAWEYWCHHCKRQTYPLSDDQVLCVDCNSDFIQLIESQQNHPKHFIPFRPHPTFHELLSHLLQANIIRTVQYSSSSVQQDNLDQIISQIMQNDPNQYGPPPTSEAVIESLQTVLVTNQILQKKGKVKIGVDSCGVRVAEDKFSAECSVCQQEFIVGEEGVEMPCQHFFHRECVVPWLQLHNSCPECRSEISQCLQVKQDISLVSV